MNTPRIASLLKRISPLTCLAVFALMTVGCGGEAPSPHTDAVQAVSNHSHENPDDTCFICDPRIGSG